LSGGSGSSRIDFPIWVPTGLSAKMSLFVSISNFTLTNLLMKTFWVIISYKSYIRLKLYFE
jgi:hypothetical protein